MGRGFRFENPLGPKFAQESARNQGRRPYRLANHVAHSDVSWPRGSSLSFPRPDYVGKTGYANRLNVINAFEDYDEWNILNRGK